MSQVRQTLEDLKRQLENKMGRLKIEINTVDSELADVKLALAAMDGKLIAPPIISARPKVEHAAEVATIKDMVLEILGTLPNGANANQLLRHIEDRFGATIERTSLSPQLSRLKRDGLIQLNKMIWTISNEEGPAEAGPLESVGAGWNQQGSPNPQPAGSIPVASTPISPSAMKVQLSGASIPTPNTLLPGMKGEGHDPNR